MGLVYCQETIPSCRNQHYRTRVQHSLSSRSRGNILPGISSAFSDQRHLTQSQSSDCKRFGFALDHCRHPCKISPTSGYPYHFRSWSCHHGIFRRCHTRRQHSRVLDTIVEESSLRRVFLAFHCRSLSVGQVVSVVLQQLDHRTCILDECRFCYPACSICIASRRACQDRRIDCQFGVENECIRCGQPCDRIFRVSALRCRLAEHQSNEPHHTHVFERAFPSITLLMSKFHIIPH
jgi:hypothetical protein